MIYVITHKDFDDSFLDRIHYKVLHVGLSQNCKEEYLRDDTLDNISEKNNHYCELTGQYWIWKNAQDSPEDLTGLVHYRRYFTTGKEDLLYTYCGFEPKILEYHKIESALLKHDIILPKKITIYRTVKEFYSELHDGNDLDITRQVMMQVHPEYVTAYDEVMNAHSFYFGNMLICRNKLFDKYSEWLFDLMISLESRLDLDKAGDKYQARVMGFLSERLLQVWVKYNNLRIVEYPVFNTEERRITIFEKNFNRMKKIRKLWEKNEN